MGVVSGEPDGGNYPRKCCVIVIDLQSLPATCLAAYTVPALLDYLVTVTITVLLGCVCNPNLIIMPIGREVRGIWIGH